MSKSQLKKRANQRISALALAGVIAALTAGAYAQSGPFTGFTAGNLVLTRSVYAGDATTVSVGQALPPICPTTAVCGTATATDTGVGPSASSTNNVWNNNKADGSFGITSPIFLDQITPAGTLVSTLPIPPNLVTTSFSSKSELAANLSTDGTALTFMAYIAPQNTVDVSNSNTPGAYDPTNPVGSSFYRSVVQVGANGALQVTPTNSYSGNNGRAAILANGLYYMAGNANNGAGTPNNVVATAGVQIASPGQAPAISAQELGNFNLTQVNDPSTGKPYAADKAGKDNNFRGLTIFNNTLYVSKGSGGNGINTVYQVGLSGSLPTLATASSTPITVLPGLPTILAKNAGAGNPFGIYFANSTTLYVADEGDGTIANSTTSKNAGLQKWSLANGTWTLDYVLQNGLNLGNQYLVDGYPVALSPATDGLRNITGKVNSDGTVTVYAVTSTVSANGDQGADPNKLVSITDNLANLTPNGAAAERFTTLRTAVAGEVLRGISFTPAAGATPAANVPTVVLAANSGATSVAAGSIATVNGFNLATASIGAGSPLPTTLNGTSVSVFDSAGKTYPAPLLYVSPNQVNFQVPAGVAIGGGQVTVTSGDGTKSTGPVQITAVAPGLFVLNGLGLAAANVIQVAPNGTQTPLNVYQQNTAGGIVANPIDLSAGAVYLVLYGTGLQAAGTAGVTVTVGGINTPVQFAGAQGTFAGLDQVNIQIPATLAGMGNVDIQVTANGMAANPVQIYVK